MQSVCVIGAGPSGLSTVNAFVRLANAVSADKAPSTNGHCVRDPCPEDARLQNGSRTNGALPTKSVDAPTANGAAAALPPEALHANSNGEHRPPAQADPSARSANGQSPAAADTDSDPVSDALGVRLVCFEKQPDLGGQWRFEWRSGTDMHGEPVPNSMYRHLWVNSAKECVEMADYRWDEHFDRPMPSFPPRPVMLSYLAGRAERAGLRRFIRFHTAVQWVEWRDDVQKFAVTVCDYAPSENGCDPDGVRNGCDGTDDAGCDSVTHRFDQQNRTHTYTTLFDRVVVCSGHFSVPFMPQLKGIDRFCGPVMHSHELRDPSQFVGRTVLVVGASVSGEDISVQVMKLGGRKVVLSYKDSAPDYEWPEGIELQPLVKEIFADGTVEFINGEQRNVDAIIFCTGYVHSFPFMHPTLRLRAHNTFIVPGLFRGVVWPEQRELYYIGMQNPWFTFNIFDTQAAHVRDLILSRNAELDAISIEEMEKDSAKWTKRLNACTCFLDTLVVQGEYFKSILSRVDDYPLTLEMVDQLVAHYTRVIHGKLARPSGLLKYRDERYRSVYSGILAAQSKVTWRAKEDDSEKAFLAIGK